MFWSVLKLFWSAFRHFWGLFPFRIFQALHRRELLIAVQPCCNLGASIAAAGNAKDLRTRALHGVVDS